MTPPGAARIVVSRRIPEPALELLHTAGDVWLSPHDRPMTTAELHAAIAGADAVVTLLHDRVDDAFLDAAGPGLRVVANVAVGYDNIDVPACTRRGVIATNTPGVLVDATADIAMALILMSTRRLGEAERIVRQGGTWSWSMFFMLGSGLQGKTLGIVGLGQIGAATARRARAFGMRIAYAGRRRADAGVEAELDATMLDLDELLATADVVSIHTPLSAETRHLIDARRLGLMKPTAHLVNTSRGPVVDEAALAAALRDGTIAGAGLDVFEHEPAIEPALLELENAVLLPHLGSATIETRTAMGVLAAENATAVLADQPPPTPIR
ncbi:MAG TPA: D-glycerate dehydrogenase [Gaiellales bacterium]|jgi:glyoxylate reductase|nr:D-glycerate dehydrogenase [Gaiellales bacterium]